MGRPVKGLVTDDGRECATCGVFRPWVDYKPHPRGINGKQPSCRSCQVAYAAKHASEYQQTAAGRAAIARAERKYRRSPKGMTRARRHGASRRLRRQEAVSEPYEFKDEVRLLDRHDYRCAYCAGPLEPYHVDHVVPIARGGADAIWNLVPTCGPCNSSKGAKPLWRWLPEHLERLEPA